MSDTRWFFLSFRTFFTRAIWRSRVEGRSHDEAQGEMFFSTSKDKGIFAHNNALPGLYLLFYPVGPIRI